MWTPRDVRAAQGSFVTLCTDRTSYPFGGGLTMPILETSRGSQNSSYYEDSNFMKRFRLHIRRGLTKLKRALAFALALQDSTPVDAGAGHPR